MNTRKPLVAVVDDDRTVLDSLEELLESAGYAVRCFASARDLLASGLSGLDILITDIGMPGMDGYGLVRTLREDMGVEAAELPAVAVTALARADDRRRALASGFQEHVAKPYSVAQLVSAVRSVQPLRAGSALH